MSPEVEGNEESEPATETGGYSDDEDFVQEDDGASDEDDATRVSNRIAGMPRHSPALLPQHCHSIHPLKHLPADEVVSTMESAQSPGRSPSVPQSCPYMVIYVPIWSFTGRSPSIPPELPPPDVLGERPPVREGDASGRVVVDLVQGREQGMSIYGNNSLITSILLLRRLCPRTG